MNLLVLSPWFPYPPDNGSRQRIFFLVRELSKRFTIRLVVGTQADSPTAIPAELSAICEEIVRVPWIWHDGSGGGAANTLRALVSPLPRSVRETPNPPLVAAIAAQLGKPTDAVLVCELGMDAYLPDDLPPLPFILEGAEVSGLARAVRDAPNARARLRSALTCHKGIRYWGRQMRRRYRAVTAASAGEADALRRAIGGAAPPVAIVPNGVDLLSFPPHDEINRASVVAGRMIYNGALTYGANRDAVAYFVRDILPRVAARVPDAHLLVTGRVPEDCPSELRDNPRVRLTGYLPDLRPTLTQSAVCVVPLRTGGGTRLKILEAWAAGVPVVATPIGADGLEGAVPGEHLLVAQDAPAFAAAAADLLTQPAMAESIARKARELAEARYGWGAIGERLAGLLAECIAA